VNLKDLRRAVAKTPKDVAKDCIVNVMTVSAWERGTAIPHPRHIRALAESLQSDIKEIQHVIDMQQAQKAAGKVTTTVRHANTGTSISASAPIA
jgi:transcriptional regulator with XRE-family HTH domain